MAGAKDRTETLIDSTVDAGDRGPPQAVLPAGAQFGRYRVIRRLGEGGMGVVYVAHDPDLARDVALKLVHDVAQGSQARLVREAQTMAKLQHPNVVVVHDVGIVDNRVFVAMELIDGATLRGWLEEHRAWRDIVAVFVAAGRGLAAAHAAGVVHRDFKPENVLVTKDGIAHVADFGLARSVDRDDEARAIAGTPVYMAPEQHDGRETTAATDQYAFCVALWEALERTRPFTGATASELGEAKRTMAMIPARRSPRWLVSVLRRGLAVDPAARYPSLERLVRDLERGLTRRRRGLLAIGGAALAATGAVVAAFVAHGEPVACSDGAARWRGVWDDPRKQRVQLAFTTAGRDAESAARVSRVLDRYVADWGAAHLDLCRAERRGDIAQLDGRARRRCLDQRAADLDGLVTVFIEHPSADLADDAFGLASGLDSVADCASASAIARSEDERFATKLAEAEARRRAGQFDRAITLARETRTVALAQRDEVAVRNATLIVALALHAKSDHDAARELREAMRLGRAAGDWETTAEAAIELVEDSVQNGAHEQLDTLLAEADTAVRRVAAPRLRADLQLGQTRALLAAGKVAEAGEACQRATDALKRLYGERSYNVAAAMPYCADTQFARGDHQAARQGLERAVEILTAELGADHPRTADARHSLAIAFRRLGQFTEALRHYEAALAVREKVYGPSSPHVADSLNSLAQVRFDTGDRHGAHETAKRALAVAEAAFGPDSRRAAAAHMLVAQYAYEDGVKADVRPHVERAFALFEKDHRDADVEFAYAQIQRAELATLLGDPTAAASAASAAATVLVAAGDPAAAYAFMMAGKAELARQKPAAAIEPLERAVAGFEPGQYPPESVADVEWSLAKALWRSGKDRARAKTIATTAHRRLVEAGLHDGKLAKDLAAWLRAPT